MRAGHRAQSSKKEGGVVVKLTKKFVQGRLWVGERWVSNGHWLLHRDVIAPHTLRCALNKESAYIVLGAYEYQTLPAEVVERIINQPNRREWNYTGFIQNEFLGRYADELLIYAKKGWPEYAAFNRMYLDPLGRPEKLWSLSAIETFVNRPEDPTICLKGIRTPPRKLPLI